MLTAPSAFAQTGKPAPKKPSAAQLRQRLQGTWLESPQSGPVYQVRGKALYYPEFPTVPVRYTLTPSTLTIHNEGVAFVCHLHQLSTDSLVYVNQFGHRTRLYKQR
ncbi:hypothetical protein [Hymenobacter sp. B81]|uniref:hypothetical protein n=1 Tax=Hymenobacter sp. B81 TaxID=3344878 RepID=UPI0037DD74B4